MTDDLSPALSISSMKAHVTPAEWKARVDLAACYRLVDHFGMADMMANHISARVPDEEGAFLINPYGMMYEEIAASCLIKVDLAGNILAKPDFGALNYGINKVRFPHPLLVGKRIRSHVTIAEVVDIPAGKQLTVRHTIEIEDEPKPACVAETVVLLLP